jgi:hypothetical protein
MINDGLMATLAILSDAKFPHTQRLTGRILHNVSCASTHRAALFDAVVRDLSCDFARTPVRSVGGSSNRSVMSGVLSFMDEERETAVPDHTPPVAGERFSVRAARCALLACERPHPRTHPLAPSASPASLCPHRLQDASFPLHLVPHRVAPHALRLRTHTPNTNAHTRTHTRTILYRARATTVTSRTRAA